MGSRENDGRRAGRYDLLVGPEKSPFGPTWVAQSAGSDTSLVTLRRLGADVGLAEGDQPLLEDAARWGLGVSAEGVARTVDVVAADRELGLVREHQPGVTLRTLLRQCVLRGVAPSSPIVLSVALDVLDVLDQIAPQAHQVRPGLVLNCGLVGPDTVWLTKVGRALVTDVGAFGAARSLAPFAKRLELMAYSAPEQLAGRFDDVTSDLFVLGVLMWELLSGGRRLFQGSDEADVQAAVSSAKIIAPSFLARFMSEWSESRAVDRGHFSEHWLITGLEQYDPVASTPFTATPMSVHSRTLKPFHWDVTKAGAELGNQIRDFDRAASYPGAWYFHFVASKLVPDALTSALKGDLDRGYHYLADKDLGLLNKLVANPYRAA